MKRMLINATQPEELRVALVDGQRLYDLDLETPSREQRKSNIYKARVVRVEQSLEAAFVEYGVDRHGFLPLKEVARSAFASDSGGKPNVREALREGQELLVQVEKEERGNKGAALTTFISLAGRYLVLMPNNPRAGGVSRQIEGEDRDEAREAMAGLEVPDGMGLILRTAGVGKGTEELQWDLDYLLKVWTAIEEATAGAPAPFLVYQDRDIITRAIRDYFRNDIAEIVIDDGATHQRAVDFMTQVMPQHLKRIRFYQDSVPLFSRYQIESQIESALARTIRLPSGGSIVVEPTEALTSIDINSARATKGSDIEETALNTNLEAAEEVARQLRLRDLGGLIVIDFIDMEQAKNQRAVETRMREALKLDRARVQVGRISRFGLLEMSRQRLSPSLAEYSHSTCPRCEGLGTIRGVESLALSVLRLVEEEAMKDSTAKVVVQLPVDVATFLLNEKRRDLAGIEERQEVHVLLVPNPSLETPHFEVQRIRSQDTDHAAMSEASYKLMTKPSVVDVESLVSHGERPAPVEAAVRGIERDRPLPTPVEAEAPAELPAPSPMAPPANGTRPGIFKRVMDAIFGAAAAQTASTAPVEPPAADAGRNGAGSERGASGRARGEGSRRDREDGEGRRRGSRGERGEARSEGRGERNRGEGRGEGRSEGRGERGRGSAAEGRREQAPAPVAKGPQAEPASAGNRGAGAEDEVAAARAVDSAASAAPGHAVTEGGDEPARGRRGSRRGGRRRGGRRGGAGAEGAGIVNGDAGDGSALATGAEPSVTADDPPSAEGEMHFHVSAEDLLKDPVALVNPVAPVTAPEASHEAVPASWATASVTQEAPAVAAPEAPSGMAADTTGTAPGGTDVPLSPAVESTPALPGVTTTTGLASTHEAEAVASATPAVASAASVDVLPADTQSTPAAPAQSVLAIESPAPMQVAVADEHDEVSEEEAAEEAGESAASPAGDTAERPQRSFSAFMGGAPATAAAAPATPSSPPASAAPAPAPATVDSGSEEGSR
jgi:ribonuclease E